MGSNVAILNPPPLAPPARSAPPPATTPTSSAQSVTWLTTLILGYVGVYLCRKNFSVAAPLIRDGYGVTNAEIGQIASYGTLAYVVGKFVFGPLVDRFGGRRCFLVALALVALMAGTGAFATTLPFLTLAYALNRFFGAACWGAMVKLVPGWFTPQRMPLAIAFLSLSFVFGGVAATLLAGQIAALSGNDWRWIMGGPAIVLTLILLACAAILPRQPTAQADPRSGSGFEWRQLNELLRVPQFWIVCALSFTLTLLRETFNTWTVDFFRTQGGNTVSSQMAAFLSTPFDALGALGILVLGWWFGRLAPRQRSHLVAAILTALAALLFLLPRLAQLGLLPATLAVGAVGFLAYGPYSLLAGVLALEIRGPAYVATVACIVDGTGYLAGILAGREFGRLLDVGGYALAFPCLAALALTSAGLALLLRGPSTPPPTRA